MRLHCPGQRSCNWSISKVPSSPTHSDSTPSPSRGCMTSALNTVPWDTKLTQLEQVPQCPHATQTSPTPKHCPVLDEALKPEGGGERRMRLAPQCPLPLG